MSGAATTLDRVRKVVAEILEVEAVKLRRDDTLEDLGFDALDWLSLDLEIEREFGVGLEDATLTDLETDNATIGAVTRAVARRLGEAAE